MTKTTYYQKNRDVLLSKSKEYYRNNRELIREGTNNKYKLLSEDEKEIRREYHRNRYHNITMNKNKYLKNNEKNIVKLKINIKKINIII